MDLTVSIPAKETAVIHCAGKFTLEDVDSFRDGTEQLVGGSLRRILLNFRDVTYIDSSAIGELIFLMNAAKNLNIDLVIFDVGPDIMSVLSMTYLDRFFKISTAKDLKKEFPGIPL